MTTILFIVFICFAAVAIIGVPVIFTKSQRLLREQKNYERSLKMVPLLIHLPPPSEDTQANGRDERDVTEETISKAQTIYNIIASTLQKGFKTKFYGQRHIAFEIVGWDGLIHFYAAVPIALVDVVKQAIVSAYPSAELEEVSDHNIFNPVGKINATTGGELNLKESYAYPIATYQEIKRDALQGLLNAMSTLDKEDGAAIQILLRPANPEWRKNAASIAASRRKGKKKGNGGPNFDSAISYAAQLATALVKAPVEEHDKKKSEQPELSSLDQSVIDSIDDKTRYPGYEVLIRLIASSNISQRSQSILASMTAAFSLFDAPGRNGFVFVPAKDPELLATNYIMRFFPQKSTSNILNSVELATIFHFPDQTNIPTSQLQRQDSKQVDGPRNVPEEGLLLGYNVFRGVKKPIRIALNDRQRHMYVVGQTGTGKSTFLENLALQDMLSGNGFAFVDPHGDTAEKLLAMVPRERTEDVIYFSPADMSYPMGLNLFEFQTPDQKDFLIQEALNMLYKLYDPQHQGIMGPRYEHLFRNAALTVMADPAGGTFIDIPKLFRDPKFVQQKLKHVTDPTVIEFWTKEMPTSQRSNEFGEVVSWFVSKFGAFLSNEMMRTIIGQTKSAFDLRDIMDKKKILLVNLSKGRTGELNSKLLGMIFVMKFQAAAMSRANIPEDERVDFSLYVDEFQNFSTDSFATIMSEARKYHLNLIVANQFTTQLTDEIRDAVFGNMGTIVAFRVGQNDVDPLTRYFQPTFDADDLLRIPNHNTITRTLIGGVPTQPFSMSMLPPLGSPNPKLADALKQLSAAKYGRPRAQVEAEIADRLVTKLDPPSSYSGLPGGPSGPLSAAPTPALQSSSAPRPAGKSSFLDDWLNKHKTPTTSSPTPPAPQRPINSNSVGLPPQPRSVARPPTPVPSQNTPSPVAVAPKPQPDVEPVVKADPPTEISSPARLHETKVSAGSASDSAQEDTIYIDRDGNLQSDYKEP